MTCMKYISFEWVYDIDEIYIFIALGHVLKQGSIESFKKISSSHSAAAI